MANIEITVIKNFNHFTTTITKIMKNNEDPLWYRGCGDKEYELKPSLFRHSHVNSIKEFMKMEKDILSRFKQRSVPYLKNNLANDWEYFFLMQHFGTPTRLLDWTESPYTALFFALTSAKKTGGTYIKDACVWILEPIQWNRKALSYIVNP